MDTEKSRGSINSTFISDDGKPIDNRIVEKGGDEDGGTDGPNRINWGNPIEFLLSCIAMSVGLGNVWRFPFVALQNGGGAFLIPYLIVLLVIGRPIYYLEMCIGQFSSYGQVRVWNMSPLFRGVGYTATFATFATVSFYSVLIGITIRYFFASFAKDLPWTVCDPEWDPTNGNCSGINIAAEYFTKVAVPQKTSIVDGLGTPDWKLSLTLLAAWVIICAALIKGVSSAGKVAYFTSIFPYVVLIILLVRGVTLPGAWNGIKFFLEPQWDKLYDPKVWYEAVGQCFFSLSVSFGAIIMLSSYNPFRHNIYRDSLVISFMDTFTSLLAGITIFAVLGNLAHELGETDISKVAGNGGAGLAFIAYPEAIGKFDWVPQLFAVLFFLMLFTLGLGSATALVGAVSTIFSDDFKSIKTWQITIGICLATYLIGLTYLTPGGLHILDIVNDYAATFVVYVAATVEVSVVAYAYGLRNICNDIEFMLDRKVGIYFRVCWALVIPIGLTAILIYWIATYESTIPESKGYNLISQVFAWLISGFAISLMFIFGVFAVRKAGSVSEAIKPNADWGPNQGSKIRREWEAFKLKKDKEYEENNAGQNRILKFLIYVFRG